MKTNKFFINLEKRVNFFTDEKERLDRTQERERIKYKIIEKIKNLKKNYYDTRII